ncbi:hypothetical protein PACTADRAFT_49572 [Pachysolen tannophilus NRRL Y-2460]|uniref:Uncharacterized protein n=1 Tax=Pachysolen tannophilus NRRL Y-2460 TaxID=669874 RepID=A0A1E4TWR7_PACTA|nr:hypothetical protein PACTADRAFT_49572 [Pachysolen tannophilus NRRL Y-2460]
MNYDLEIKQLLTLEKLIFSLRPETSEIESDYSLSNITIPKYLLRPYLSKVIKIIKREFLDKFQSNYTMICQSFLKQQNEEVNSLIGSYVQLIQTTTFINYIKSSDDTTKKTHSLKLKEFYESAFDRYENSEKVFKEGFRDRYHRIVGKINKLIEDYEIMKSYTVESSHDWLGLELDELNEYEGMMDDQADITFLEFLSLKEKRTMLRNEIDDVLMDMLKYTKLEARVNGQTVNP